MSFEVWSPIAQSIDLVLDGETVRLALGEGDWWSTVNPLEWRSGLDYGYRVDGGEVVPDPRSRRQPSGVHALSRTFDPAEFVWTGSAWRGRELQGSLIYELHVGTFSPGGTLDSAIEKLDHLVDLGVSFVELLPVNGFNGAHNWGYDGVLWYTVHEGYGGPAAYQRFVDACHARGLAVVQDVVYNHLGPSGNYLSLFGPYLADSHTSWGEAVNLDGDNSYEVRQYILDNVAMWVRDYHVDGLRLDAVHALRDTTQPHLLFQLAELADALAAELARPVSLIAESDLNDSMLITPRAQGGYGLTAQWSDDYHHAAHVAVTGETSGYYSDFDSIGALAKVLVGGFFHDGTHSSFRGRTHGKPIDTATTPSWRLVTFTQNHDQIGNRAAGDRPSSFLSPDLLAIEAMLAVLTPFTPMLFMGQEWGASTAWQFFTSHPEPELGRAVSEGRLAEFEGMAWDVGAVPDPQDPATFERSKLDWGELHLPPHSRMLELYRSLVRLRARYPEFSDPSFVTEVEFSETERWLRFERGDIAVAINFGGSEARLPTTHRQLLVQTGDGASIDEGAMLLPPRSGAVCR